MMELQTRILETLYSAGAGECALLSARAVDGMLDARAQAALDRAVPGWRGLICMVIPYFAEMEAPQGKLPPMARYARGRDYHVVLKEILESGCSVLREAGFQAGAWVDASPFPEVRVAALCGLGVIGRNGLLLTPRFGSWVFIGCLATDAPLSFPDSQAVFSCADCGACEQACPVGAIRDGRVDGTRCLSALSQKSGELTAQEAALLRENRVIWGCDRCQEVCPANQGVAPADRADFTQNLLYSLPESVQEDVSRRDLCQKWPQRAFTWKGLRVLQRNVGLFEQE